MPFSDSSFYFFLCIGHYFPAHPLHPQKEKLKAKIYETEEYWLNSKDDSVICSGGTNPIDPLVCKPYTDCHKNGIQHVEHQTHVSFFREHHPLVVGRWRICNEPQEIILQYILYKSHSHSSNCKQVQGGWNIHSKTPDEEIANYSAEPELHKESLEGRADIYFGLCPIFLELLLRVFGGVLNCSVHQIVYSLRLYGIQIIPIAFLRHFSLILRRDIDGFHLIVTVNIYSCVDSGKKHLE